MGDTTGDGLTAELVISTGGWDPRFARVLLIERSGDRALVLVDGNGDGAELEVEYWEREADGGWQGGASSGHGGLDSLESAQTWKAGESVYALGRIDPGSEVTIRYASAIYRRRANEFGIWGFVQPYSPGSKGQPLVRRSPD